MIYFRILLCFIYMMIFAFFNSKMLINFYYIDSSFNNPIVNKSGSKSDLLFYCFYYYIKPLIACLILFALALLGLNIFFDMFYMLGLNFYVIIGPPIDSITIFAIPFSILKFTIFMFVYIYFQKRNLEYKEFEKIETFHKYTSYALCWVFISILLLDLYGFFPFATQG